MFLKRVAGLIYHKSKAKIQVILKDTQIHLKTSTKEIIKIKNEKELAKLKLRSFDKSFYRDIDGICFYEKIKPKEKFDKVNFEKDHPDIFEELSVEVITPNFNIKKDLKNINDKSLVFFKQLKIETVDYRKSKLCTKAVL